MTGKPIRERSEEERVGGRLAKLELRQSEIGRDVRLLKDLLDVQSNSHATLLSWIGKLVTVTMNSGRTHNGRLLWIDKYNVAVDKTKKYVLYKGNVESISLLDEET